MTPFGQRLRELRAGRGVALKDMAAGLGVSPAYLSALEHGRRGKPSFVFVQAVIHYFNIIWDEAEALQRLADISDPRPRLDTAGLSPAATELANRLARRIGELDEPTLRRLLAAVAAGRSDPSG